MCVSVWYSTKIDGNLNWAFRYKYARVLLCFAEGPSETNASSPALPPNFRRMKRTELWVKRGAKAALRVCIRT